MMPIVDAHVGLSQNHYSLKDYLDAPKQFHVLRMVCVQQNQSVDTAKQELQYLQSRATTRGSGGFPHSIMASGDLSNPDGVAKIVALPELDRVRGICHHVNSELSSTVMANCMQSMEVLSDAHLCLDLQTTLRDVKQIAELAAYQPAVNIIVSIFDPFESERAVGSANWPTQVSLLAKHENVFFKLCGIEAALPKSNDVFAAVLVNAIKVFGYERIMFSSGISHRQANPLFDQLWSTYDNASSMLSAKQRNYLFRLNAVGVYGL